jgi:5-methylcytosine-specific restriction endonuclease McrA
MIWSSSAVERSAVAQLSMMVIINVYTMTDKRTYADRAKYLTMAVAKRRRKIKAMSVEYLGGKCQLCGYCQCNDVLEFHHKDETKKRFGIGQKGYTRSWERVKQELDNCYLLCANCHREVHAGVTQLPQAIEVETRG